MAESRAKTLSRKLFHCIWPNTSRSSDKIQRHTSKHIYVYMLIYDKMKSTSPIRSKRNDPCHRTGIGENTRWCFMHITTLNAFCLWLPGLSGMGRKFNCPTDIGSKEFIRKSKDYVYGIWVYKVLGIWKGYYRVTKSLVSCMKQWTEAREREREREIKFIGLFGDRGHRGPYSPYKPYWARNNDIYMKSHSKLTYQLSF